MCIACVDVKHKICYYLFFENEKINFVQLYILL